MEHTSEFKMGSLFDGSGGFPLASVLCDIEPVWASEIEPFPIRVTKARFPNMKHYGDISQMDVNELETVDLITGGSPCQDMSVAGKRQGMSKQCPKCDYSVVGNEDIKECPECGTELQYTRSGLFMEQIRIVKEMRKKDELEQLRSGGTIEYIRPRFMLWENVTGAFSSNNGEDFRAVLEETAKIKDPSVVIPRPPKGKWPSAGCIVGDGYSIAWRVLDAQYWGVPQRRRRIALVADFGGECAGEILFKRDGLSRNFTESRKAWERVTGYPSQSIGKASEPFCYNGENLTSPLNKQNPQPGDPCHTLGTDPRNYAMIPQCIVFEPGAASRVGNHTYENQCGALRANMGDNQFAVAHENRFSAGFCTEHSAQSRGIGYEEGISPTLRAGVVPATIEEQYSVDFGRTADRIQMNPDKSVTLLGEGGGAGAKTGLYCLPKEPYVMNERQYACTITQGTANTLTGTDYKGTQCVFIPSEDKPQKEAYSMNTRQFCHTSEEKVDTLLATDYKEPQAVFQPIQKDLYCMATQQGGAEIMNDLAPTITAAAGMSGNNQPVINQPIPIQDQAISNGSGNGLGIGKENDPMYTLMADTQHGIAYSLQGNMIGREDHNGPQGNGVNEDVSFTLNTTDRHAVVYGIDRVGFNQGENALYDFSVLDDQSQTLIARGPNGVCHEVKETIETEYIVRRLTPLECSRLQGFPDWWVDGLQNEKPDGYDIAFWRDVFETHRKIVTGASKPKTDKWIIKWLKEEPKDGAMYKMWGNGIALPCFIYVIEGIKEVLERTSKSNSSTTTSEEN